MGNVIDEEEVEETSFCSFILLTFVAVVVAIFNGGLMAS